MAGQFDVLSCSYRHPQRYQLEQFRVLVEHHGPGHAAFLLGVTRKRLDQWLRAQAHVPHAAGALLWLLSPWGRHTADIERDNLLRTLQALTTALQARTAWLEAELVRQERRRPALSANDAFGADRSDPRSQSAHPQTGCCASGPLSSQ